MGHWRCDSAGVRRAGRWFRRKELREAAAEEESGGCLVGLAAVVCWLLELSRPIEGRTVVGRESKKKKEVLGAGRKRRAAVAWKVKKMAEPAEVENQKRGGRLLLKKRWV